MKRHMHPGAHHSTFYNTPGMKQPGCPSTHEWIKKLWYIYTMETTQPCKGTVLMRWMNLEPIIQNEVSQKEKDKYCILAHIYGI